MILGDLYVKLDQFASTAISADDLMTRIVHTLNEELRSYNWVGFYLLDGDGSDAMLVLGPFVGAPTEHARIPLNRGICGAAASTGQTVVVDDVHSDPRYLACSLETKSEIVAPVLVHGKVAGELDIDSHDPAAFGPDDRALVEYCAGLVGRCLEKSTPGMTQ